MGSAIAAIWGFLLFVPLFLLLLLLGVIKGILIAPLALLVIFTGSVSVALGLWPAIVFWTLDSVLRSIKLGFVLKLVVAACALVALVLLPFAVVVGSLLVGIGYGFFTPLVATFEAVGKGRPDKCKRSILDGTSSTVQGSCTVVRDFTDLCYHSCPAYLADFRDHEPKNGPYDIRLQEIPPCFMAALFGVILDMPLYGLIALVKSPLMLVKGWERLLDDLIVSQDGACVKVVCVPFAGLAIILWPLAVVAAVVASVFSSFFIGLYAAVVVHKEKSFKCGLAYAVSMVAEFDEYSNDVLYLREGSCLPRPMYSTQITKPETAPASGSARNSFFMKRDKGIQLEEGPENPPRLGSSRSLKRTMIEEVKMLQIWDHMFKTCERNAKELLQEGVVTTSDFEQWIRASDRSKCRLVNAGIPSYTLLRNLMVSAKANSTGLILYNGVELTSFNKPQDRLLDWFFDPLLVLKEQIRVANLLPSEERFLEKITLLPPNALWENGSVVPQDDIRKGELEAISRRIQGIATSTARLPTFRRKYENFIKSLLQYSQSSSFQSSSFADEQV